MVHVNGFTYGALTPVLGYALSTLGCFLGLRCTSRARALHGAQRARWLLLAALSIGDHRHLGHALRGHARVHHPRPDDHL